jgi:hypothetical protein
VYTAYDGQRGQPALISSLRKLPLTVQDVQSGGMYAGTEHKPASVRKRVTLPPGKALAAVVATLRFPSRYSRPPGCAI